MSDIDIHVCLFSTVCTIVLTSTLHYMQYWCDWVSKNSVCCFIVWLNWDVQKCEVQKPGAGKV